MYTGLLHLHSFLRWIIILLLLIVVVRSFTAGQRPFNGTDRKFGLFAMIACDITLLIGLYQWLASPVYGLSAFMNSGMKAIMSDKTMRFFSVEHFAGMIIAIILVHIGRSYARKNLPDVIKHKRTLVYFGLALLIILISIPWPFRQIARGWF
jgi:hypothetical protein